MIRMFEKLDVTLDDFWKGHHAPAPKSRGCRARDPRDGRLVPFLPDCNAVKFLWREGGITGMTVPRAAQQRARAAFRRILRFLHGTGDSRRKTCFVSFSKSGYRN